MFSDKFLPLPFVWKLRHSPAFWLTYSHNKRSYSCTKKTNKMKQKTNKQKTQHVFILDATYLVLNGDETHLIEDKIYMVFGGHVTCSFLWKDRMEFSFFSSFPTSSSTWLKFVVWLGWSSRGRGVRATWKLSPYVAIIKLRPFRRCYMFLFPRVVHFTCSRSTWYLQQQHVFSMSLPNQLATPLLLFSVSRFPR